MGETDLRDALAVERTHLANERTLLSYIRTSLAMLVGGAMALRLLEPDPILGSAAWAAIVIGSVILVFGSYRFFSVRKRIVVSGAYRNPPVSSL